MGETPEHFVRTSGRKATVEIQKRPPKGGRADNSDPSKLPLEIRNAFPPESFDAGSAILACNFPPSVTINQAGNYFRWLGPVVRVDRADSVHMESNFVVIFATAEHAERANNTELLWDEKGTRIYTRMADKRGTLLEGLYNWMGWGASSETPSAPSVPAGEAN